MNRRLFSLLAAAAIMAAPAVHAQAMGHTHRQRGDSAEHAQMMARLNLTADQKTQIDAIHKKYGVPMKGAHDSSGMARMGAMHRSDSTMTHAMAEVRAVLHPDQQVLFDSMMTEHMKRRAMHDSSAHHGMKRPPGSTPT